MTKPQVILDEKGQPAYAVIPWRRYKRLSELNSDLDLSDEELYDRSKSADEESFPIDVADRLLLAKTRSRFTVFIAEKHRNSWHRRLESIQPIFHKSKQADVPDQPRHWLNLPDH